MSDDYWDCPCCERPVSPENDKECHCGKKYSHHLSVSAMCRIMHNMSGREAALIVRNKKLEVEVNEQARLLGMSAERECDLRGKLERERALADRLAGVLELYYADDDIAHHAGIADALAAWKEARSE